MLKSLKMTEVAETAPEETTTAEETDLAVAVDSEVTEILLQEEKADSEATEADHQTDPDAEAKAFLQTDQKGKVDFLNASQDVLKTDRNFRKQEGLEETKPFS